MYVYCKTISITFLSFYRHAIIVHVQPINMNLLTVLEYPLPPPAADKTYHPPPSDHILEIPPQHTRHTLAPVSDQPPERSNPSVSASYLQLPSGFWSTLSLRALAALACFPLRIMSSLIIPYCSSSQTYLCIYKIKIKT